MVVILGEMSVKLLEPQTMTTFLIGGRNVQQKGIQSVIETGQ